MKHEDPEVEQILNDYKNKLADLFMKNIEGRPMDPVIEWVTKDITAAFIKIKCYENGQWPMDYEEIKEMLNTQGETHGKEIN